ncbi:tripartite tricarboxylate transporter substrate binding protein [soil metagenome]
MNRFAIRFTAAVILSAAVLPAAFAQGAPVAPAAPGASKASWPTRAIRMVVPSAPGGSNDVISRVLAQKLTERLGQSVVIDNKAGAGGTVGTDFVAKAPADGYTVLFTSTSLTTNAAAGKKLPYDPVADFAPVAKIAAGTFVVIVGKQVPARTLPEFIAYAKQQDGKLNYGSAGIGGISHLGTELLLGSAGIKMTHVPYKGMAPAFTELLGGGIQMALPSLASAVPHLRSGNAIGLATTGTKRSALAPDIPTAAESGLPGYKLELWWGLFAPAGTPPEIVARLNREANAVLAMQDVKDIFIREGAEVSPDTPEAFGALVREELGNWTKVIRDAHIVVE